MLMVAAALAGAAHAATLRLETIAADPAAMMPLHLASAAGEAVAAMQFDFVFSASLFSVTGVAAGPAATAAGKEVQSSVVVPGRVRCLVAGLNREAIPEGVVVNFELTVAPAAPDGAFLVRIENAILADPDAGAVPSQTVNGVILIGPVHPHSADTDVNWRISLSELLRVIQLFASREYHCAEGTEDGFAGGPGPRDCPPHDSDYGVTQNWRIGLSELLRLIQFFNSRDYHVDTSAEDGFALGPVPLE